MAIPILIPTRNEQEELPNVLGALSRQSILDIEPIVIDGTSTDETIAVAKDLGATVLRRKGNSKLDALNTGFMVARDAKLILCTDADTTMGPDWVAAFVEKSEDTPGLHILTAGVQYRYPKTAEGILLRVLRNKYVQRRDMGIIKNGGKMIIHGQNFAIGNMSHRAQHTLSKLPSIGYGEDQAIAHCIDLEGGTRAFIESDAAVVATDGARYPTALSALQYFIRGKSHAYTLPDSDFAQFAIYDRTSGTIQAPANVSQPR